MISFTLAPKTADDWIWSLIRRKLDTLEEAGLGNSASHVTTETYGGSPEKPEKDDFEDDDWDDDDAFLECLSQNEQTDTKENCKNPENSKISKRKRSLETNNTSKKTKTANDVLKELSETGGFKF